MARNRAKMFATINSVEYAVEKWETVQQGRLLEEKWTQGFAGGMGDYLLGARDRYYMAKNMDTSMSPFIRLRPCSGADIATANLDPTLPVYVIMAADGSDDNYFFVLNGRRAFKFDADAAAKTLHSTKDFGANAICGRPAYFESKWRVPLGASVSAVELTTVAVDANADTWDNMTGPINALHFAAGQKDGTAQLARAHSVYKVDLSADASDWTGDDYEVGESGMAITDLLSWVGEWAVVKQDSVYSFDALGNSFPLQEFVGKNQAMPTYDGSNSFVHGPYLYWAHSSGLWRFIGQRGMPIEPASDLGWLGEGLDSHTLFPAGIARTRSVGAWGRWLYAVFGRRFLLYGYIRDDGTVQWHGSLFHAASGTMRCSLVGSADVNPFLVITDPVAPTTRFIALEPDGSVRTALGVKRGAVSDTAQFWFPNLDFGDSARRKQLRHMWITVDAGDAQASIQLAVHKDRATTSANVGAVMTSGSETYERSWTPGTADLAFEVQPTIKITTTGSYTTAGHDPRIRAFGIQAATLNVYRAVIPLTTESIKSGQNKGTAHQALRNLLNGPPVVIVEPTLGGASDTFNGRIIGYSEEAVKGGTREGDGWIVALQIERYDYGS